MTPEDVTHLFVQSVERLMAERGWERKDFADALKMKMPGVSRMLNSPHPPSTKTLARVATVFGVSLCELLCEPAPKRKK